MPNPNLSNPEKLVNEARLNEYHQTILPYLGGHIECGFTPVGAVIMMSGNEAPKHYLKCDGTVYNIADYPELAAFYARSQGSCNFYGGNGTTTFAVPDYRGEFVRGTGTNSHANQGNGAAVGVHQDGTTFPDVFVNTSGGQIGVKSNSAKELISSGKDFQIKSDSSGTISNTIASATKSSTGSTRDMFTSRPTNTSVLFCVASKNIYLDARFDYSLEEKVVGEWIDGKPIYQKTFQFTDFSSPTSTSDTDKAFIFPHNISNPERYLHLEGYLRQNNAVQTCRLIPSLLVFTSHSSDFANAKKNSVYACVSDYGIETGIGLNLLDNVSEVCITLQYTKTTDA